MKKQRVDLNDFSAWSVWPARLLGLAPWTISSRTIKKIDQEYDKDKYARCLDYYIHAGKNITPEEVKQFEFGLNLAGKECVSLGNNLYEVCLSEARATYYRLLVDTVRDEVEKCETVIELGCGYGYNLWMLRQHFPTKTFFGGGEYSENAVHLASLLYQHDPKIKVWRFNFYDDQSYKILERVSPPIVVLTVHAIEQLQSSSPVLDALLRHRESIQTVFHFEPVYQLHDETLLGLMRRRYTELNGYNTDLLLELQQRSYIRIIISQAEVLGLNPLNPTSVIQWEFTRV